MAEKHAIVGEHALRALRFLDVSAEAVNEARGEEKVVVVKGARGVKGVQFSGFTKHIPKTAKTKFFVLKVSEHNELLLPGDAIKRLAVKLYVDEKTVLEASRIPERTFHRRQEKKESLTATESDRVMRIARIGAEAGRVFGDETKAARWLSKVNRMLGAKPLDMLASDAGSRDVEAELQRIDQSDFA